MAEPGGAYAKGLMGESKAREYLQQRGMILLHQRYRSPYGEIDLIMRLGEMLVFVEVKARSACNQGAGLVAVTPQKQERITRTAAHYMAQQQQLCPARFDVVEVSAHGVIHIPNAFEARGLSQ